MRAINRGQLTFALTCGSGFYAPNLTTLGKAPPGSNDGYIAGGLGFSDTVTKSNYVIMMTSAASPGSPGSCNGLGVGEAGQGFRAAAAPASAGNTRFFGTNANSLI